MKVVFSGVSYKRYMMGDSITSLPYGHPLLEKHIYRKYNNIEYDNSDYQQDDIIISEFNAEQKIYLEHRPLYIQKQMYETGRLENTKYAKIKLLQLITDSKFT